MSMLGGPRFTYSETPIQRLEPERANWVFIQKQLHISYLFHPIIGNSLMALNLVLDVYI